MPDLATLGLTAAVLLAAGGGGDDGVPRVRDLEVEVDGNLARVSFELAGGLTTDFVERVASGLPTGFVYRLELLKDRKRWLDRGVDRATFQIFAMYDAATRGYLVNYKLDGELVESRMVRDVDDLERALTRVEDLPVFHLDNLPRSWRLLVRVQAEVGTRTLLGILPSRLDTEWAESAKFHSLNRLPDRP
jgi:hypothetical protein